MERMIGGMVKQKYSIIEGILPITFIINNNDSSDITVADEVIIVCCTLVNLCLSIVPVE